MAVASTSRRVMLLIINELGLLNERQCQAGLRAQTGCLSAGALARRPRCGFHDAGRSPGPTRLGIGGGFSVISFADYNGVDPQYATAERPAFSADGGWRLALGFSRHQGDLWYGGFIRYIDISAATFADSPLVKTNHSLIGGIAIAWIFAKSGTPRK